VLIRRRERLVTIRDKLLTNPRFLKWAAAFPPTRIVARARARALFDLCAGFVYSQILFACVKLRLFDLLRDGPKELAVLAARLKLSPDAATRLLDAASALRLAEKRGLDRYGLGPLGAAVAGNPGIAAMVEHHTHFYADLKDPIALLRGEVADTELGRYWPYASTAAPGALKGEDVAPYSTLMALSLPLVAEEVLDAYPVNRHRIILDVGGGEGVFVAAAAARAPRLNLILFDVPAVADRAKLRLSREGLSTRSQVFGGDFLSDLLPEGADLITLIRVILDHDDAGALKILESARRSLDQSGTLLIAEPLADTAGTEAMAGAYFGFYLLAMGGGRPRTREEFTALLQRAGFSRISFRCGRQLLRTGIVVARP
jgi:demethylspheroidene O-methyltransferase